MDVTSKVYFSVLSGAVLSLALLFTPGTAHAKDMSVIRQSDGSFEVEFPNGCSVEYDRHGNRGRSYGRCKDKQLERADDGVRDELGSSSSHDDPGTWYGRLVGANGRGAETQMENHDFYEVDSFSSGRDGEGTVWYNRSSRQCLQMIVVDERVDSVVDIHSHPKCNSHGGGYDSDDGGTWYSRLVGAAEAGAENQMDINGFHEVDSFSSGRNGRGTVWYNNSKRQCLQMIVVNGRVDSAVDIHSHPKCNSHGGGYGSDGGGRSDDLSWFSRLVGANGNGAEVQMENHGFNQVDSFDSGRDGYGTVWYSRSSRQCLQMIVVNDRVDSAVDIHSHPRCR